MHSVNYILPVEGGKTSWQQMMLSCFSVNFMTVCEEVKMLRKVSYQGVTLLYFQVAVTEKQNGDHKYPGRKIQRQKITQLHC